MLQRSLITNFFLCFWSPVVIRFWFFALDCFGCEWRNLLFSKSLQWMIWIAYSRNKSVTCIKDNWNMKFIVRHASILLTSEDTDETKVASPLVVDKLMIILELKGRSLEKPRWNFNHGVKAKPAWAWKRPGMLLTRWKPRGLTFARRLESANCDGDRQSAPRWQL